MPHPPKDPEDFDKVNYVIDSWANACEAPWYIYVETLKPALLEAFIVLISFGWADVIRGRFRPKGLGRRTGKRKGKWAKSRPRFPEIGNTLGKSLPFGEQLDDFVKWGTKTKFLWRIDNAMQAGLFMWLVADVVEDFAFNWTSLLYKTYWCREANLGRFSYRLPGLFGQSPGIWRKTTYSTKDYENPLPSWHGQFGISPASGCQVAATFTWTHWPPFDAPTETGIMIYDSLTLQVYGQTGPDEADPGGVTTMVATGRVPGGRSFRVATYHQPDWSLNGDGVVMAVENPPHP